MKRLICAMLVLILTVTSISATEMGAVSAHSAALYDPLTGSFLFEKDADTRRGMASTTKIMTAMVALDYYLTDQVIEIKPEWCGIEGSSMYLAPGERLTVDQLLHGLLLMSGNDAAVALACALAGSQESFAMLMNDKAQQLGLENTSFENPSGLDGEQHYSTAKDMALLAAYAMQNADFARIVGTKSVFIADRNMVNHNKLLYTDGFVGVKTGYTMSNGRCLVSAFEVDGRMLIAVTLNAPDDWDDHKKMSEYAQQLFSVRKIVEQGVFSEIPVVAGDTQSVSLYTDKSFEIALSDSEYEQLQYNICGPRFTYGGVKAGDVYGQLQVVLNGNKIFTTQLFYEQSIERELPEPTVLQKIGDFLRRIF